MPVEICDEARNLAQVNALREAGGTGETMEERRRQIVLFCQQEADRFRAMEERGVIPRPSAPPPQRAR